MSGSRDTDNDYVEVKSPSTSPKASENTEPTSPEDSSSGQRTPQYQYETRIDVLSERSSRVSSLIMQAAHQAKQEEQAQATARTAAQIAQQKRKMRGRARRIMHSEEVPEAEPYDTESAAGGEVGRYKDPMAVKDSRGLYGTDTKGYNLPLPPAFALLDIGKPGKKSRQGWFQGSLSYRVFMWSFLLMSTLITLVGVSLLVAFVVFHPKKPTYALEEVRVESWSTWKDENGQYPSSLVNGVAVPTVYLFSKSNIIISVDNPNDKLSVIYPNTTVQILYHNVPLGTLQVESTTVEPNTKLHLISLWSCDPCAVPEIGDFLVADQNQGTVPLHIKMKVDVGAIVSGIVTPQYTYESSDNVRIRPPGT